MNLTNRYRFDEIIMKDLMPIYALSAEWPQYCPIYIYYLKTYHHNHRNKDVTRSVLWDIGINFHEYERRLNKSRIKFDFHNDSYTYGFYETTGAELAIYILYEMIFNALNGESPLNEDGELK